MSYKFNPFTGNLDEVSSVTALNVKGTVADSTALNALTGMAVGDVYQQEDNDIFYVYDGANWDALGTLVGPQGATGATGATGPAGADGADGADGANGTGVAAGGTDGQVLTKSGSSNYNTTWTTISTGGLGNIVEDTTPQLGGALDLNGNNISGGDNVEIILGDGPDLKLYHNATDSYIEDTGTGSLIFKGSFFKFRDTSNNNIFQASGNFLYLLKPLSTFGGDDIDLDPDGTGVVTFKGNATKGSGQFKLNCEQNSHGITIKGPPHSAAASYTLTLPNDTGTNGQALLTNGSGTLSWGAVVPSDNAVTGTAQTFTAAQRGTITTLTDGATITPDFAASNNYTVTLGGNRTIANPSNLTAGQSGSIFIVQDGTGSRTASFGSYWDFAGGTAPTLTTTASAVDRVDYIVQSTTSIHAVFTANYS